MEHFAPILPHICCATQPIAPNRANPYRTCRLRHEAAGVEDANVQVDQDEKATLVREVVRVAVPAVVEDTQVVLAAEEEEDDRRVGKPAEAANVPTAHQTDPTVVADIQVDEGLLHAKHHQTAAAAEVVRRAPAEEEQGPAEGVAQRGRMDYLLQRHPGDPVAAVEYLQRDYPPEEAKHMDLTAAVPAPKLSTVPAAAVPRTENSFAAAAEAVEEANPCQKDCLTREVWHRRALLGLAGLAAFAPPWDRTDFLLAAAFVVAVAVAAVVDKGCFQEVDKERPRKDYPPDLALL